MTETASRARSMVRNAALARPLLAWGVAWVVGSVAWTWVPDPAGVVLGLAACAGAAVVSWRVRDRTVRRGMERSTATSWVEVLVASPVLLVIVAPLAPLAPPVVVVFLAALWGLGLLLFGIATADRPLCVLGCGILVAAAGARLLAPDLAVVLVGTGGGLAMAALGWHRLRSR